VLAFLEKASTATIKKNPVEGVVVVIEKLKGRRWDTKSQSYLEN